MKILKRSSRRIAFGSSIGVNIADPGNRGLLEGRAGGANLVISEATMRIIDLLAIAGGAVAMFFVIWNGIRYITAGGEPKKAEEARKGLLAAMVGIVLLVAVRFIIALSVATGEAASGTATNVLGF